MTNEIKEAITEALELVYLKQVIKDELFKAVNEDKPEKWITVNGNHIKIEKDETPNQAIKKFEIKNAIQKILNGEQKEIIIKNIRDDLIKYGDTNDIAFIAGNEKGGILHIDKEHKNDFDGVINTIVKGKVTTHIPNRKVFLETEDYLAILSLDYFNNKKTWLLTGYKKDE